MHLRCLDIDLDRLPCDGRARPAACGPFGSHDPRLAQLAAWGGSGALVASFLAASEPQVHAASAPLRLALAVGSGVVRGLPTAARVGIAGIAPLTGRYAEGALGSDLARRLAGLAELVQLRGRAPELALLVLEPGPTLALHAAPELRGLSARAAAERLIERFGPCGLLVAGPAGEAGVAFATLASGHAPPSFVGRGGLGALFGALGLKALVVRAPAVAEAAERPGGESAAALSRLFARSPRLRARASDGTLEIGAALAVREPGTDDVAALAPSASPSSSASPAGGFVRTSARKGCEGCPTPCGLVFERSGRGARPALSQGVRFSAVEPLLRLLEPGAQDDALELLARCDELGVDAREAAAVIEIARTARGLPRTRAACEQVLDELLRAPADAARGGRGAAALARALGVAPPSALLRGQSARREATAASRLGLALSARGGDPLRTLSFLAGDLPSRAALAALVEPWALPPGAEDPRDPRGKGLLLWWSENLANALDAQGVCAFSCAALLADGVVSLEELARAASDGREGAREFLVRGASIALAQHRLAGPASWGAAELPAELAPAAAEYAALRGLDEQGAVRETAWQRVGSAALLPRAAAAARSARIPARPADFEAVSGQLVVTSHGPLARQLAPRLDFVHTLPAPWGEVLASLARHHPRAAASLWLDGRPIPVAYRSGTRVDPADLVHAGDQIDLVVALSGG